MDSDSAVDRIIGLTRTGRRRVLAARDFFTDTQADWLSAGAALAFALSQARPNTTWWFVLLTTLGGTCLIASVILTVRKSRRVSVLVDEITRLTAKVAASEETELREREAFRQAMSKMSHRLCVSLGFWTPTVRLTIYGWADRSFIPLVRVSSNPLFAEINRTSYPDDQGVLSEIWTRTPVFQDAWRRTSDATRVAIKSGMPEEVYGALVLKPLSIFGIRVDMDERKLGIILIESTNNAELDPDTFDHFTSSEILADLKTMMIAAGDLFEEGVLTAEKAPARSDAEGR